MIARDSSHIENLPETGNLSSLSQAMLLIISRPIITKYGVWDQVRVDCGTEFYLLLHIQDQLSRFRTNTQ